MENTACNFLMLHSHVHHSAVSDYRNQQIVIVIDKTFVIIFTKSTAMTINENVTNKYKKHMQMTLRLSSISPLTSKSSSSSPNGFSNDSATCTQHTSHTFSWLNKLKKLISFDFKRLKFYILTIRITKCWIW